MKLKFSPVRYDERLVASIVGDVITLNGIEFDFTPLKEGHILPVNAIETFWIVSDVTRKDGEIELTLLVPHGPNAPYSTLYPDAFITPTQVGDGVVDIPAYDEGELTHD